ncbi:peptidoglycan DD-metalloendopeptidase family protein [Rhodoferax sp. AJA081-3]|uniref:peptidoglycan DD-metalloendopeptidase family protein n=1 Tax=Rhodoferax sp. AJA081-3 TaxID=2752316 RepID=UPI001AE07352|nr:peptidoglycan DD-metalloendopeptidase family protein [Rhodoferax sp. AJA081-3]QTN28875.1 peptidoglycan DD-metalloendopeptidase family protein [Rhodoferax sp. AJA081-3]
MFGFPRSVGCLSVAAAVLVLSACGSKPLNPAPVEDRASVSSKVEITPPPVPVKQPPGFENAGKAGYYTVKPKDTLIGIGLEAGQSHKDIARWNNLENPNRIEIGQVLRVTPPVAAPAVVATTTPSDSGVAVAKPVSSSAATATPIAPGAVAKPASAPASGATASASPASAPVATASSAASGEEDLGWIWPGSGPVLAGFDEAKNKGLDIGGAAGDAVLASSDGKVVYAGAGLRGYGNLIILKHNNTYLTAYAHNQTLLVKEDQTVKKGQKIAEMGSSDADRVKLHFEVRRQGKPVDPAKYLPAR